MVDLNVTWNRTGKLEYSKLPVLHIMWSVLFEGRDKLVKNVF